MKKKPICSCATRSTKRWPNVTPKKPSKLTVFFEVNTGAISRGYRQTPYPSAQLLHVLKREGGKVMLSSDSHAADTIDCAFTETRQLLKDIGFQYVYVLYDGQFQKDYL